MIYLSRDINDHGDARKSFLGTKVHFQDCSLIHVKVLNYYDGL